TTRVRRRGVTKVSTLPWVRPAAASFSFARRAKSAAARACMRAGTSSERISNSSSATASLQMLWTDSDPGFAAGFRQSAYSPDIGLALRYRNDAAGVQQIEKMAGLETAIVGRKRQTLFKKVSAFALGILEVAEE